MKKAVLIRDAWWWSGWLLLALSIGILSFAFRFWRNDPRSLPRPDGSHLSTDEGVTRFRVLERHDVLWAETALGGGLFLGCLLVLWRASDE